MQKMRIKEVYLEDHIGKGCPRIIFAARPRSTVSALKGLYESFCSGLANRRYRLPP